MAEKYVPIDKKPRKGDILWDSINGKEFLELKITGWKQRNIATFEWMDTSCQDSIIVYFPSDDRYNSFLYKAVK